MENELRDKHVYKRSKGGDGIGFAIFLILFGGIFLCLNTGIIDPVYKSLLISWQMLLIVIGLWSLIVKRHFSSGIILILVGLFFIYPKLSFVFPQYFTNIDIDIRTYWPVLLIIGGIILAIGSRFPNRRKRRMEEHFKEKMDRWESMEQANYNSTDFIDKNLIFGGSEQIVLSNNFRGGEGNVMFGELIIDLRKSQLAEGMNQLELNALFGSVVLYVSSDWSIDVRSSSFMASVEDKRHQTSPVENSTSSLLVKASAMFGSIELRN